MYSVKKKTSKWGTKMRTPEVQIFVGCKRSKWGTVPQNGVRLATLPSTLRGYQPRDARQSTLGVYYPRDLDDVEGDECELLGLGDFFFFNLMILFILNSFWLFTRKVLVALGCIVSIQVGHLCTRLVRQCWNQRRMPDLPFPVIAFSLYSVVINALIPNCVAEKQSNQI